MRPDFSEFSYGFAFTHEYVNRNPGLKAAPELPSLIKEAEKGYDLKLGYRGHPKYFQFKLSAHLDRRNAIHWQDHGCPHYRVRLTTRPRLNRPAGTDQHSKRAPLKDLPCVSDNDVHYMTFTRDQKEPWWHSEAVRLEGSFAAEDHYATIREMVTIDENFFRNLRGNLRAALNESEWRASLAPNLDDNDDIANVLRDTYRLLTAQYGLQMVTLTEDGG